MTLLHYRRRRDELWQDAVEAALAMCRRDPDLTMKVEDCDGATIAEIRDGTHDLVVVEWVAQSRRSALTAQPQWRQELPWPNNPYVDRFVMRASDARKYQDRSAQSSFLRIVECDPLERGEATYERRVLPWDVNNAPMEPNP